MKAKLILAILALTGVTTATQAQDNTAPWIDKDGFFARPGVEQRRIEADLAVCKFEAGRVYQVRTAPTPTPNVYVHTSDPVAGAIGAGIGKGIIAAQDASYARGLTVTEHRDCMTSLGYQHYRLDAAGLAKLHALPDAGFADYVSAATPLAGKPSKDTGFSNYYDATLQPTVYPMPAVTAKAVADFGPLPPQPITRLAPGEQARPAPGMAVVVVSARLADKALIGNGVFVFRRVTTSGTFNSLVQPAPSFVVSAFCHRPRYQGPNPEGPG
ncbi:hypothetical protein [Asticcacaulis sp. AC402]|uniref:hypothetical protein n=1 Tax=Asticcacaulis sp. AC402 TaxID=1282361 RepID=UPI0003FBDF90|nr:hypothetical protein [Asticcacaulis sp. AC402]